MSAWVDGASVPYRTKLSPDFRLRVAVDYVITRATDLPAGLFGGDSKTFLVLAGVPAPRGDPGHSCVLFMDGFRFSSPSACLGEARSAIERLQTLPAADRLAGCRVLDAPADAAFEAVAAYQPEGAVHSFASKWVPAPIVVRVSKPGNVVLVFNSYEPANWQVSFAPDTRVVGVVLSGYYASNVEDIDPGTPVIRTSHEERAQRVPADPACAPFHAYLGTAYAGGPDALVLDRQTRALTGGGLDGLRGAYKLGAAEIR